MNYRAEGYFVIHNLALGRKQYLARAVWGISERERALKTRCKTATAAINYGEAVITRYEGLLAVAVPPCPEDVIPDRELERLDQELYDDVDQGRFELEDERYE